MMKKVLIIAWLACAVLLPAQAKTEIVFGWGDSGRHYAATEKPVCQKNPFPYTAWRGERVNALALLWSPEALEGVTVETGSLCCGKSVLPASALKASFVSYVIGDELAPKYNQCGKRDTVQWKAIREADLIGKVDRPDVPAGTVQSVWLSIDVPADAVPGRYKGTLALKAGGQRLTLPYVLNISQRTLTLPAERPFHLDLWQNPYTFARIAGVRLWSPEHFAAMRPVMERLANAGQKVITATLMNRPWNGQTEDPFGSMVTKIRRADGSWLYDYTVFDRWVEFMMSVGIDSQINCYTLIPWKLEFDYFDQATGAVTTVQAPTDSPEYEDYWGSFILDFSRHLRAKGWFEKTMIAMDERGEEAMRNALTVIHKYEPEMRVALAGSYHASVADEIDDLCLGFREAWPEGVIERRRAEGKISTYYTCCAEGFPNTFIGSQPAEACWLPLIALQKGADGYLRWAYNSWTLDPEHDARFRSWAAGDTYMVYPEGRTSVRFEKFVEGLQDYEKARLLLEEWSAGAADPSSRSAQAKARQLAELQAAIAAFTFEEIAANGPEPALHRLRTLLTVAATSRHGQTAGAFMRR